MPRSDVSASSATPTCFSFLHEHALGPDTDMLLNSFAIVGSLTDRAAPSGPSRSASAPARRPSPSSRRTPATSRPPASTARRTPSTTRPRPQHRHQHAVQSDRRLHEYERGLGHHRLRFALHQPAVYVARPAPALTHARQQSFLTCALRLAADCDGASFSGFRPEPWAVPGTNSTVTFRGIKNLDATVEWALAHGLDKATQFVLMGDSAGGLSTFLHADRVIAKVRAASPAVVAWAPVV